jgi:hypothetical protein
VSPAVWENSSFHIWHASLYNFPCNLASDFTHYLSERPEPSFSRRGAKEGQNQKKEINKKKTILMKTQLIKTTIRGASVALLVSASLLLLVAGTQGSGVAPSGGSDVRFPCTNATIRGTYGIQMQGTGPVPPPVGGTQTLIGVVTRTYDGMGNFTQIDNIHGSVTGWVPNRPGSGTYQVNPDCTAATQFQPAPGAPVIEERVVIVDGGSQLYSVTVSPLPVMVSTVAKRTDPR